MHIMREMCLQMQKMSEVVDIECKVTWTINVMLDTSEIADYDLSIML